MYATGLCPWWDISGSKVTRISGFCRCSGASPWKPRWSHSWQTMKCYTLKYSSLPLVWPLLVGNEVVVPGGKLNHYKRGDLSCWKLQQCVDTPIVWSWIMMRSCWSEGSCEESPSTSWRCCLWWHQLVVALEGKGFFLTLDKSLRWQLCPSFVDLIDWTMIIQPRGRASLVDLGYLISKLPQMDSPVSCAQTCYRSQRDAATVPCTHWH